MKERSLPTSFSGHLQISRIVFAPLTLLDSPSHQARSVSHVCQDHVSFKMSIMKNFAFVLFALVIASGFIYCNGALAPENAIGGVERHEGHSHEPSPDTMEPSPSPAPVDTTPVISSSAAPTLDSPLPTEELTPTDSPTSPVGSQEPPPPGSSESALNGSPSQAPGSSEGEPSPSEDEVCIDASALEHLSTDELVYKEHRRSAVLCDKNGSCATPGHMVVYEGEFMMMSSYCTQIGGCAKRVMSVNSPRHRRALKIVSRTIRLEYTSLAAKYATVAEEHVLKTLLRVGL